MSPAKRSIAILSGFIAFVFALAFVSARIAKKHKTPGISSTASKADLESKPLFYKSVGGSNQYSDSY
jgi:hypothetical protein